jgi:hypoxanthine phosphoribosyltransferase
VFVKDIKNNFDLDDLVIVSPDVGGVVRARHIAQVLGCGLAIVDKRREKPGQSEVMNIIGEVSGKNCILVDDIIDTGETLCKAAALLKQNGAKSLIACVTHAVFSSDCIDNIQKIFPNLNNNNNNNNTNNSTNNTTTTTTNNQITAIVPVEVSSAPVETKYEPVLSNKEAKETSFQNNNELKAIDENKENRYYEKLHKEPTYSDLYQKISDSNKMTEDIRTKIDYLYQNNIPKSNKNTKKSLTISPVVYTTDGYEYLDQQYSSVRPKSEEDIYDSSNRNITMINNTIKDINHKIRKIKKSSKTRS